MSLVLSMWGHIEPQWRLLKSQLETKGPGWYSPLERERRLITNRSNRPGDDMKEELRDRGGHIGEASTCIRLVLTTISVDRWHEVATESCLQLVVALSLDTLLVACYIEEDCI